MLTGHTKQSFPRDVCTGILIALVSIPISMGYAQIAGLPAKAGLYGSILPILIFGTFSSSPQFIFGVDAAPAALAGAFLVEQGIEPFSAEAEDVIPLLAVFTGLWLLVFALFRAGRLTTYISAPVMGGFISGICTTIILMQVPKLLGGSAGSGELPELIRHIIAVCRESFHAPSLAVGAVSLGGLLLCRKFCPRFPAAVLVMACGAVLGFSGAADSLGLKMLDAVPAGLPALHFPAWQDDIRLRDILVSSLTCAAVIMSESLLAASGFAEKNGYTIRDTQEILLYGVGNLAAALTGCCPVNGSVSRTALGGQYGGKSQVMSLTAAAAMCLILLFGTGFIGFLPVPVLTAIVISALMGAVETHLAVRLFRQDKRELAIFMGAFFGVLMFGTVAGVATGVVLSFISLIMNTANPKRSFLGVIEGHEGFHSLERNTFAAPIAHVILYRFSSNLYFANVHLLLGDLEQAIRPDTTCIIVDSGAVCSMDITAADKLERFRKSLNERGISLYFASHIGALNDRFRELGLAGWVENGYVRRTIPAALRNAGFSPPYVPEKSAGTSDSPARLEFEWAFGAGASGEMERYAAQLLANIGGNAPAEHQLNELLKAEGFWQGISDLDREVVLAHLEGHIPELAARLNLSEQAVEQAIGEHRLRLAVRLVHKNPAAADTLRAYNKAFNTRLKERDPALWEQLSAYRKETLDALRRQHPEHAELLSLFL